MSNVQGEMGSSSTGSFLSGDSICLFGTNYLFLTKITIEPIIFVLFLASSLTDPFNTNILHERSCTVIFNYTEDTCKNHLDPQIEKDIQAYTAKIIMLKTIFESVVTTTVTIFVGPWSDINGRKVLLLLPIIGNFIYYIVWLVLSFIPSVPPVYFFLASLPFTLSGGLTILFTGVFSYITDITFERNRAFRMIVTALAIPFGILSSYVLTNILIRVFPLTYSIVSYLVAIAITFILILYIYYCVPETIRFVEVDGQREKFFTFFHIKQMKSLITERPAFGRLIFCIITLMIGLDVIILQGESTFRYLALKKILGWSMDDYNIYSAVLCISSILASTLGMWILNEVLKFREMWIVLLVSLVSIVSSSSLVLSETALDFYLAGNLGVLITMINPILKAEIVKIFCSKDAGKIFAFLLIFEAWTPFVASASYTAVYNKVIAYRPQDLYYLSASFFGLMSTFAIVIIILQYFNGTNYEKLIEDEHVDDNSTNVDDNQSMVSTAETEVEHMSLASTAEVLSTCD